MAPVMVLCTRHSNLKFPAFGNATVNFWPVTMGGLVTQVEPSKAAPLDAKPGHPTVKAGGYD